MATVTDTSTAAAESINSSITKMEEVTKLSQEASVAMAYLSTASDAAKKIH